MTNQPDQHPALAHCQRTWPRLTWMHNHQGDIHHFWGIAPLGLEIRLEIMGDRGAMAEFRTGRSAIGGQIFKRSRNELGVPWQEAIEEIAFAVEELSNSIKPENKDGQKS